MNDDNRTPRPAPVNNLELKAALLLALFVALVAGTALYLLYARGSFETTQRLVLVADDAEGVTVGMDLTFSGFPIGRVQHIELSPEGNARILIDVPKKDAHWLRTSSIFTLVRGVVGNTNLRAYTGQLQDPLLADNAERKVLAGDATQEELKAMSQACLPTAGACAGQFTANTMGMVSEALGLAPIGSSMVPAVFSERAPLLRRAAKTLMAAVLSMTTIKVPLATLTPTGMVVSTSVSTTSSLT